MATTTAYLRVSTEKQTIENQHSEIQRFACRNGITVDRWVEEVVSGKVKENFCLADNINSKVILFAFGLAAEIERDLISARTKEALAARKEQGVTLGRKQGDCPKMQMLLVWKDEILRQHTSGMTISELCKRYGVSTGTMSKFLNMCK